jgi:hypothetical protein
MQEKFNVQCSDFYGFISLGIAVQQPVIIFYACVAIDEQGIGVN